MIVLAIDTATDAPGVALRAPGGTDVRPIAWRESFGSTVPSSRDLLRGLGVGIAEVEAVVVPTGPGSFTGLRVGATIALGLARAGGPALHGVPTLVAVAAAGAPAEADRVVAVIDARRGRWYGAIVSREDGSWRTVDGPHDRSWSGIESIEPALPRVGREPTDTGEPIVARALVDLVVSDPERWRVDDLGSFGLLYARPGADR